jgi:hypothetical protein
MSAGKLKIDSLNVTPTWVVLDEAIKAGRTAEALRLMETARIESEKNNDNLSGFIEEVMAHLACFEEEQVEKVVRNRYTHVVAKWISTTSGVEETLVKCIESHRLHQSRFTVKEEDDRYVVTYDPCGTGGRLRRLRNVGVTKAAYPWSWMKAGVPYYCTHCCIHWEILPIEQRGYPIRISIPGDRPEDPCVHLFYKKPELIPEEYFRRVGAVKKPI